MDSKWKCEQLSEPEFKVGKNKQFVLHNSLKTNYKLPQKSSFDIFHHNQKVESSAMSEQKATTNVLQAYGMDMGSWCSRSKSHKDWNWLVTTIWDGL